MQNDLTQGNLLSNILHFSIPFFLSYFLQTLYGLADLLIVGQYNGANVISAVSIGSQVMHMFTVMIVGLAMGTTVMIGRMVGSKEEEKKRLVIGNSFTLFIGLSFLLMFGLSLCVKPILSLLSTPLQSMDEASKYLRICFLGIPFIVLYNLFSSIFRGLGDSKSPMIFIAIACIVNIVLDLIFIGPIHMKAVGAAYATVIAQAISVFFALIALTKMKLNLKKDDFKISHETLFSILKIGVPIMVQDGFIQISFLIITMIANQRGVDVAAAVGIVEKIISFLFLVPSSMLSTVSTIVSQSMGAKEEKRAQDTLYYCIGISVGYGLIVALICQIAAESILALFTSDLTVITLGSQYLHSYVLDCVVAGVHFCFSGFFAACNYSILSFVHNLASIILARIPGAYFASIWYPDTLFPMGLAAPIGGMISILICLIAYRLIRKKLFTGI